MRTSAFSLILIFLSGLNSSTLAAERIITLAPVLSEWAAELLGPLEAKKKLIGVSEYSLYPSFLKSVQTVGAYPQLNVERIAALKPDLIIASYEYNRPEQLEQLTRLKLPVQVLKREEFGKMGEWIEMLGSVLDRPDAGKISAKLWNDKVAELKKKQGAKERTLFLEVQHQPLVTIGADSFLNDAFALIGYENIFKDLRQGYPKVSKESVLKLNPDVIFVLDLTGTKGDFELAKQDWEHFKDLRAVKAKKVLLIPGDDFGRCSFRLLEALKKI